jgi:hypothetical protein
VTDVSPRFKTNYPAVTWRKARLAVIERDSHCQLGPVGCGGGPAVHHRRLRSQGGTNDPLNLVLLCDIHHGHIHANPAWSYDNGWLRRSGT